MSGCSHTLYRGAFPSLERALAAWLSSVRTNGLDPALGIVPSNRLGRHLERSVASQSGGAIANLHLWTFLDLARRVGDPDSLRPRLDPTLKPLLLAEALGRSSKPVTRRRAQDRGFAQALCSTLSELRDAGPPLQSALAGLDPDLTEWLDLYERALDLSGHIDPEGELGRAGDSAPELDGPGLGNLFCYGFYDFTPGQRRLIESIGRTHSIAFFVPAAGGAADAFAEPTLQWLQLKLAPEECEVPDSGRVSAGISMARSLFRTARKEDPADEPLADIELIEASGSWSEAEAIADSILRQRSAGTEWHEIAILLREESGLRRSLLRALGARSIPVQDRLPSLLGDEPIVEAVCLCLRCVEEEFAPGPLFQLLQSPYLTPMAEAARGPLLPQLRRRAEQRGGAPAARTSWLEFFERVPAEDGTSPGGEPDAIRQVSAFACKLLHSLPDRNENLPPKALLESFAGWLGWFSPPKEDVGGRAQHEADCLDKIRSLLGQASRVFARSRPMQAGRLARSLRRAIEDSPAPEASGAQGGVQLLDLMRTRGVTFPVVALPGLIEGSFPRPLPHDPFLPDDLRERLDLPRKDASPLEERLLFALAIGSSTRHLILSHQRTDTTGKLCPPSPFLREVHRLAAPDHFHDPDELRSVLTQQGIQRSVSSRLFRDDAPDNRCGGTVRLRLHYLHRAFRRGSSVGGLAGLDEHRLRIPLRALHVRRGTEFSAWDGLLGPSAGEVAGRAISASRLEDYSRCPFSYFAKHVLGLDRDEVSDGPQETAAMDRGLLIHDVLEKVVHHIREEGGFPLRASTLEETRRRAHTLAERILDRWAERQALLPQLLTELDRRHAHRAVDGYLDWEASQPGDWIPIELETRFGFTEKRGEARPPLLLDVGDGEPLRVRGIIDRIDRSESLGALRILDYKTGAPPRTGSVVRPVTEDRYQLALYSLAADQLIEDGAEQERHALYLHLYRGTYKEREVVVEDESALLDALSTMRSGIEAREFFLNPGESQCHFCDFKSICRRTPASRHQRRLRTQPAARAYAKAKGLLSEEDLRAEEEHDHR